MAFSGALSDGARVYLVDVGRRRVTGYGSTQTESGTGVFSHDQDGDYVLVLARKASSMHLSFASGPDFAVIP